MTDVVTAYIALGANLGDPRRTVEESILALDALPRSRLLRASSLYRTAPVGFLAQPDFINAVAAISTALPPRDLLALLLARENEYGRVRSYSDAPRVLDLDLLLYGETRLYQPDAYPAIILPHPRLHLRAFALLPLAEIAPPDLLLPGCGKLSAWLPAVASQAYGVHRL
ncbi:MAG: 2-amino-4-hydroxy-6-hydroxymethyldihydropteridine diphosphokinase [Zoogloeaceae bacterium]|jgi:2-amino-4-hydroxy-6-hydroxymethyldihydropteridine diphosphokinase|nr:2-amino-4-hydroxy-6-hydroxymethyldihydropteridine diphosphokinase [Zoogloeaceae bacterium]